ncbi:hypothetical protein D0T12_34410 [Actinomadura spongiicola]|uniref:Solute-binding protein family 5 domain-containing protein n=1 Tax=Actinomadura spongiicola TaxID=2303421 RepID=A0A372G6H5_9ACTN|nr:ABC transporter substrate-binding protein [Actinomadura spongiicola]RFS80966.1 hypothetical protein D0T12_34410 [Actinomadura spongiicola]
MDIRPRPRRRPSRVPAVLIALLITGCSGDPVENPLQSTTVRIAVPETAMGLKPDGFWHYSLASYGVAEHLLRARPDGTIEPWLAASFTRTRPNVWRLKLREGVSFHSGRTVDARAVVAALKKRATQGYGADSISKAKIEATGPLEVTLTSPKPTAAVPRDLASSVRYYMIYDVAAAERAGDDEKKLLAAGVYTGPYRPTAVDRQSLRADAFPRYWGRKPALTSVQVLAMPDSSARLSAVRSGEADIAITPPTEIARTGRKGGPFPYRRAPIANRGAFAQFNLTRAPFDDAAVRQAFTLGVDYARLPSVVAGGGIFERAGSVVPGSLPFAAQVQRTDPARAAALLDGAGWRTGAGGVRVKDGRPLRVTYLFQSGDTELEAFGIAVREQLRPLGFDVAMKRIEDSYDSKSWPKDWSIAALFVLLDGPNVVDSMANWLGGGGGANFGGVKDTELDTLIGRLQATTLDQARADLSKVQALVAERAYATVLGFKAVDAVVAKPWANFSPDPDFIFVDPALAPRR